MHTSVAMKRTKRIIGGVVLLLLGLLIIAANYFVMNNSLYGNVGGVGILCVVAGAAMAFFASFSKE